MASYGGNVVVFYAAMVLRWPFMVAWCVGGCGGDRGIREAV